MSNRSILCMTKGLVLAPAAALLFAASLGFMPAYAQEATPNAEVAAAEQAPLVAPSAKDAQAVVVGAATVAGDASGASAGNATDNANTASAGDTSGASTGDVASTGDASTAGDGAQAPGDTALPENPADNAAAGDAAENGDAQAGDSSTDGAAAPDAAAPDTAAPDVNGPDSAAPDASAVPDAAANVPGDATSANTSAQENATSQASDQVSVAASESKPAAVVNGWATNAAGSKMYYKNGALVSGEMYIKGNWYHFDEITHTLTKGWKWLDAGSKWVYYHPSTGVMIHGESYNPNDNSATAQNFWYYFDDATGATTYGWKYLAAGAKWVYYKPVTGTMVHGESYNPSDNKSTAGHWYYFDDATGATTYGWKHVDAGDKWCYYDETMGWMLYGEQCKPSSPTDKSKHWYYFDDVTGATTYGWKWLNSSGGKTVYYAQVWGWMLYGRHKIDGATCYFDKTTGKTKYVVMNGIDIHPDFQKGINLTTIDGSFVFIKITQGTTMNLANDHGGTSGAKTLASQALAAGKKVGFYHFVDTSKTAKDQADYFVSAVGDFVGQVALVLDWENNDVSGQDNLAAGVSFAKEFLDRVYATTGVKPLIYTSRNVVTSKSYDWSSVASSGYKLWLAQYLHKYYDDNVYGYVENPDKASGGYGAWSKYGGPTIYQYTSKGRLDGFGSNLDFDVFYGTNTDWAALCAKK